MGSTALKAGLGRWQLVNSPFVVGVTGGIGSGKSTVCAEFSRLGITVIDADQVARDVVAPGGAGLAEVIAEFGPGVLAPEGGLDRGALRRLVFAEPRRRERLESILHPLIRARTRELLACVLSPYCVLAIPLLVEKDNYELLNRILVVDCPLEAQVSRVIARDNLTASEAEAIIRTQATREQRLAKADDVITNAADFESVKPQVERLHHVYLSLAESAGTTPP